MCTLREQITIDRPEAFGPPFDRAIDLLADAEPRLDRDGIVPLLGLLAAGRFDRARVIISADAAAADPLILALALGRHVAWSGDLHRAASLWQRVRESIDAMGPVNSADGDEALVLHAGAILAAERLASDLGDPAAAARLHRRVRDATALVVQRAARFGREEAAGLRDLVAAAGFAEHLPPTAWSPTSCWGDAPRAPETPAKAAALLLDLAHSRLGLDPDATRHRLRLRPLVPSVCNVHVRDIGFGDATIALGIVATDGRVTITVQQDTGALPATVLLEPLVTGPLDSSRIDGRDAALAPRPCGSLWLVPVQLVLDAPRSLELMLDAEQAKGPPTK
jgi:hypothetical protein